MQSDEPIAMQTSPKSEFSKVVLVDETEMDCRSPESESSSEIDRSAAERNSMVEYRKSPSSSWSGDVRTHNADDVECDAMSRRRPATVSSAQQPSPRKLTQAPPPPSGLSAKASAFSISSLMQTARTTSDCNGRHDVPSSSPPTLRQGAAVDRSSPSSVPAAGPHSLTEKQCDVKAYEKTGPTLRSLERRDKQAADSGRVTGSGPVAAVSPIQRPSQIQAAETIGVPSPAGLESPSDGGLANVNCRLDSKALWDRFYELGTEMIITKSGRYIKMVFSKCIYIYVYI